MTAASQPLTGEFMQLGYVTKDIDAAIALYSERYGVSEFLRFSSPSVPVPGTPTIEVALAYHGPVMIEFIRPDPEMPGIYGEALREDGGIAIHHLGYYVDEARFETLGDQFRAAGIPVPVERRTPMGVSLIYADTRADTGLYSEFILLAEAGREFFAKIPKN